MKPHDKETARMLAMANAFYEQAEAADLEIWETIFFCLLTRNEPHLGEICREWNIHLETE